MAAGEGAAAAAAAGAGAGAEEGAEETDEESSLSLSSPPEGVGSIEVVRDVGAVSGSGSGDSSSSSSCCCCSGGSSGTGLGFGGAGAAAGVAMGGGEGQNGEVGRVACHGAAGAVLRVSDRGQGWPRVSGAGGRGYSRCCHWSRWLVVLGSGKRGGEGSAYLSWRTGCRNSCIHGPESMGGNENVSEPLFNSKIFCKTCTVAFLFVCEKYCPIMD